MERISGDLEFVVVYLDVLLVFSSSKTDQLEHLRLFFDRMITFGVTLNGKTCHMFRQKVDHLGYTLTKPR